MKTKGIILAVITALAVGVGTASGATNEVSGLLQKGLFEEEANRNLDAAIQAYQAVLAQTDKDRQFAATAVFRLGECYRKQGKTNEANVQYRRIVREFADQNELVTLSQQQIGTAAAQPSGPQKTVPGDWQFHSQEEMNEFSRLQTLIKESPDLINATKTLGGGALDDAPLVEAVRRGWINVVRFLLENKADTEVRGVWGQGPITWGQTPIMVAASAGNVQIVEMLINHRADLNASVPQRPNIVNPGYTALHFAAAGGHNSVVEALLNRGVPVDQRAQVPTKETALMIAAKQGFKTVVETLIAHGAQVNARRDTGATALHEAAYAGNAAIVELLLANKADVNAADTNGATALYMAADIGSPTGAEALIGHGADLNLKTVRGMSPLMEAVAQKRWDVAELLLKHGADATAKQKRDRETTGWSALNFAIDKDNPELVKELLEKGAEVDAIAGVSAPTDLGLANSFIFHDFTPLMQAIFQGKKDIAEALLAHKADINFRNENGETPLLAAVKRNARDPKDMVELLLNHKADLKSLDKDGWSVLQHAVADRHPEIVQLLLEHGADANPPFPPTPPNSSFASSPEWKGITPLGFAIATGQIDMAKLLLKSGAEVNVHTASDRTPMHMATGNSIPVAKEMIELLLARDANVNATDNHGNTPLDLCGNNTNEITELLRKNGAIRGLERGTIRIRRGEQAGTVFWRDANGYNRHTLYEVLGYVYPHPLGLSYPSQLTPGHFRQPELPGFYFPDFAHMRVVRVEDKAISGIRTNSMTSEFVKALDTGDCYPNIKLQWGDVIELPELDHNVSENWLGLSEREKETLKKCLERRVKIVVKGKETKLTLAPEISTNSAPAAAVAPKTELPVFWLSDVVRGARVILASSDVTHITVKRKHPVSGKPEEMMFDLNKIDTHSDLWLEDGDVIEIPEKTSD